MLASSVSGYTPPIPADVVYGAKPKDRHDRDAQSSANAPLRAGHRSWPLTRAALDRTLEADGLRLFSTEVPAALVPDIMLAQAAQYRGTHLVIISLSHEAQALGEPHETLWQHLIDNMDEALAAHLDEGHCQFTDNAP
jgi:hypothetical protein